MSNGRRAWRKWCRRHRHREGGAYPAKVARRNSKRHWAWMGAGPPNPQPRPWSPRSLVGMSQNHRKNLAAKAAVARAFADHHAGRVSDVLGGLDRYEAEERKRLRIGECLRPCLIKGWPCRRCAPNDERYAVKYRKDPCDGSGVLPARKAER